MLDPYIGNGNCPLPSEGRGRPFESGRVRQFSPHVDDTTRHEATERGVNWRGELARQRHAAFAILPHHPQIDRHSAIGARHRQEAKSA